MAITLPDFTALPQVTPQAGEKPLQYPANDPGAVALGELGKGVTAAGGAAVDYAAYDELLRTKQDRASADAAFSNRVIPLNEQLKEETDPEKIAALRSQYQTALEESGAAIGNPMARDFWMKSHSPTVATGQATADLRTHLVAKDKNKADLLNQLTDTARNGAAATDPQAFDIGIHNIDQTLQTGVANGTFGATEAQQHGLRLKADMTAGRIDTLIARRQYDEANAVLDANRTLVGAAAAAGLENRIEVGRSKARVKGTVDALTGTTSGYTLGEGVAGAPAGPAGPGFDDFWGRVKKAEGGVGPSGEAKVSPAGAIGVSQILKETARGVAQRMGVPYNEKRLYSDQAYNESLGRYYLQEQLDKYGGNRLLAAAAYNAGPHRVDEWLQKFGDPRTGEISDAQWAAQIPFSETKKYVRDVGAIGAPAIGAAPAPSAAPGAATAAAPAEPLVPGVDYPYGQTPPAGAAPAAGGAPAPAPAAAAAPPPSGPLAQAQAEVARMDAEYAAATPDATPETTASVHAENVVQVAKNRGVSADALAGAPAAPPAAAPGARAPAAPAAAAGAAKFTAAGGDSIARSGIVNGNLPGSHAESRSKPVLQGPGRQPVAGREAGNAMAVGGRDPQGNLDYLNAHPDEFRGQTVFWSTGLMNAGETAEEARKALPIVTQQLDKLKELGANVVLVGVDKGRFAPLNRELDAQARAHQMPFGGPLPTNNVHPGGAAMKAYVDKAQQLLPSGGTGPAPAPLGAGGEEGPAVPAAPPAGQLEPGNIDLNNRPVVKNPDGSISTVASISINEDGKEVLIPTVAADGSRVLTNDEAIKQYHDTGQHLGKFDTVDNANAAAEALHQAQAEQYASGAPPAGGIPGVDFPYAGTSAGPQTTTSINPEPTGGWQPHFDLTAKEQQVVDMVANNQLTPEEGDRVIATLRSRNAQYTSKESQARKNLETSLTNGAVALQNGRPFNYSEDEIRHFYPKVEADKLIQGLRDATDDGKIIAQVRGADRDQLETMRAQLQAGLDEEGAPDQAKRQRLFNTFDKAAKAREVEIGKSNVLSTANTLWGAGPGLAIQNAPDAAGRPLPDINEKVAATQQLVDAGKLTPAEGEAVTTELHKRYHTLLAAQNNESDAFVKRMNDGMAMLASGREFDYDPALAYHYLPRDKADLINQGLEDLKTAGQMISTVRNATPQEIAAQRAALETAMQDPNAPDYTRRQKLYNLYNEVVKKHEDQLWKGENADPGAYVRLNSPVVDQAYANYRQKFAAFQAANQAGTSGVAQQTGTAELAHAQAFADYAQTSLAEQRRLGVPEAKLAILPKAEAADLTSRIASIDPTKQSPVAEMRSLARGYGSGLGSQDYWPQVFGELVQHKLPGPYQLLATMDRPDQVVAASDLSRALGVVAQKGAAGAAKEAAPSETKKGLEDALDTALDDFKRSTGLQQGGEKLYDTVKDGARLLAEYYGYRGQNQNDAVAHAVDGIVGNKYDFGPLGNTDVRVPKGTMRDVSQAAEIVKADLRPEELGPVPVLDPTLRRVMTQDQAKAIWMGAIQNGGWAVNRDDSGLVLMGKFRDGAEAPVVRSDGSQVVLKFDNVPAIVGAAPMPVPMSPEDIGARPGIR